MSISEVVAISPTHYECRCCLEPTKSYIKVEKFVENIGDEGQTYQEIWEKIIKFEIPPSKENNLPQQICLECSKQLINSYKFIQQACKVAQHYINVENAEKKVEDTFKSLQESLMEISEITLGNCFNQELIEKHSDIESDVEIKEELEDSGSNFSDHLKDDDNSSAASPCSSSNNSSDENSDEESSIDCDFSKVALPTTCDICHKQFGNEKNLIQHKRYTHASEEDKIPCPLCTYKANRPSNLRHHIKKTHGADKVNEYFKFSKDKEGDRYSCDICSISYARKYNLHKHIRKKHQKKTTEDGKEVAEEPPKPKVKERFLCTYCGQSYSWKNSLKTHIRTHTGERPYVCEICNKSFKRLMALRMHQVVHSDEKPFICSICGKGFKLAAKLKQHNRVHSEARPFKCNECGKAFKYNCVLKSHMYMHTGELPFPCKTCGAAFALRTSLNYHCRKNGHEK